MKEIAKLFFRLGLLGFGGPIAVMAMLEEECAEKRDWITKQRFSEMYAVFKMLPGPLATQMAIYLGFLRGGIAGGLLSGFAFILPAFVLVLGLSIAYVHTGVVAQAERVFAGLQAGALVVILLSGLQLAKPYKSKREAWVIGALSAVIIFFAPRWEPVVILCFGVLGALWTTRQGPPVKSTAAHSLAWLPAWAGGANSAGLSHGLLAKLFWVCFKAGAFVFGSGLAIVPMLEGDTVRHYHWLTHSEFMDGLAIGQVTPGPVVITSTFIGYKVAGLIGASIATFAMFFPAFFNVLIIVPRTWDRISGKPWAKGFTGWAIPAVVGAILGTTFKLGYLTITGPATVIIFVLSLGVAIKFKPPAWILIPAAGFAGALLRF